jgi:hypothetical protein
MSPSVSYAAIVTYLKGGYGLFSVSPSHFEAVRKYILDQEEHHKEEPFQQEYLRILKNAERRKMNDICGIELNCPFGANSDRQQSSEGVALGYDGSGRWPAFENRFTLL